MHCHLHTLQVHLGGPGGAGDADRCRSPHLLHPPAKCGPHLQPALPPPRRPSLHQQNTGARQLHCLGGFGFRVRVKKVSLEVLFNVHLNPSLGGLGFVPD